MSLSHPLQRPANMHCLSTGSRLGFLVALLLMAAAAKVHGQSYPTTDYSATVPPAQAGSQGYDSSLPPAQPVAQQVASLPQGAAGFQPPIGLRGFEPTEIMAMVGDQPILACDILPDVDRHFEEVIAGLRAQGQYEGREMEVAQAREEAIRMLLSREVQRKLAYVYFLRKVDPEMLPQLEARIYDGFNEQQLPKLMERFGVETSTELDARLREGGSSLLQQRRMFKEQVIASEAMREASNGERTINHEEMLAYYQEHREEFSFEAQVRWEQLMVRFGNYPNKAEAFRALANMGNEVLRGAPLDVIARRSSEGTHNEDGGQWDWTTQGSLAWKAVDDALFTLPEGSLSPILEDAQSFHIVRVIERREAGFVPFREAQAEIQEKILEEYRQEKIEEFIASLENSTTVWTIFDDQPESSQESMANGPSAAPR